VVWDFLIIFLYCQYFDSLILVQFMDQTKLMLTFTCSCSWFCLYFSSLLYIAFPQTTSQRAAKHPENIRKTSIWNRGIHKENFIYHKKRIAAVLKL